MCKCNLPYWSLTNQSGRILHANMCFGMSCSSLFTQTYDPVYGHFLQTDPIGSKDDLDLYEYTHYDPIKGTDPSGLGDDTIVVAENKIAVRRRAQRQLYGKIKTWGGPAFLFYLFLIRVAKHYQGSSCGDV